LLDEQVIMTPLAKYIAERSKRFSLMGKRSQAVQAERRMQSMDAETLADLLAMPRQGDAIGQLEYHCFRTGKVRRWAILRGDRADRVMLRSADGRQTQSHGWTWVMEHLRGFLAGRKM
jgi:hypothetical protein